MVCIIQGQLVTSRLADLMNHGRMYAALFAFPCTSQAFKACLTLLCYIGHGSASVNVWGMIYCRTAGNHFERSKFLGLLQGTG